ncbi:MAG: hypothetical protein QOI59_3741 [Gammaproteobacteria bacterium]|jgi:tetratricopeptide (TPR) repeat protein|nr:hypothetical protein [Gammaproteobacteria bacterium]
MLLTWLKAQDAVEAGSALADTFPTQTAGDAIREFVRTATQELQARKLNFYKRVRFANAFKWRLLEKGVAPETANDVTQTLLIGALTRGTTAAAVAAAPRTVSAPAKTKRPPVNRKALDALFRQAVESFARGAHEEAVAHYQEYVALRPQDAAALNNLGAALSKLARYEEAKKQFHNALAVSPKNTDALSNLGNLFSTYGRFADAENYLRRAVNLKPTDPLIRTNLGVALANQGLLDKSRTEFEKVLKTTPGYAAALSGMGTVERSAGRFAAAEQMFRRALEVDSNLVSAWVGLAGSRRMASTDAQWIAAGETIAVNTTTATDEAAIRFAMGKCFDDLGQYPQAFEQYQRANELLKPLAFPFEERVYAEFVNDLKRVYTPQSIASAKATGSSSTRPVFVVGMPRSGTSLVEQILAAHPAVAGGGELDFWTNVLSGDEEQIRRQLLPEATRQKLATDYLQILRSRHPDAGYVVDKAPRNADIVGLIHTVFPDARFIYMRRDPRDTCLSCFFQNFPAAHNYKFDLNDLASYYREHARLVAHWRKVLPPGTMLDVPYEELVADQETWTRRIVAFIGLEWDERCLRFEENPRPVVTSSSWQVRQRMYGDSVKRWRHYSKFVGPLRKLDPA